MFGGISNFLWNHSMATANLKKSEEFMTNATAASKYIPRRPRISINWWHFLWCKFPKIKIFKKWRIAPKFFFALQYRKKWTKVVPEKKIVSLKKSFFWNFMKWGLKGGISIDADSGPPMYELWCCFGICYQQDNFI